MDQFQVATLHEAKPSKASGAGQRIYAMLRAQMADGSLGGGARMPSTRSLASELGVSRNTVTAVYEQLAAEGYLLTAPGRVARIAPNFSGNPVQESFRAVRQANGPGLSDFGRRLQSTPMPAMPGAEPVRYDFLYGAVAYRDFPTPLWRKAYQAALLQQQKRLYYQSPEGEESLRRALQAYLRRARGLQCSADQILVVNGSQQAIDLCARVLLSAGDGVLIEDPGYRMARSCFEATGARCLPVAVDAQGLQTDALPTDCSVRLAYTTPSHQFPLGAVLSITRRVELLAWARRHNAWIVEDDYDGEFRYGQRPIDALQSIDEEGRVIYVGTFSKTLSPQLRQGYLVLPAELVQVFRQAKRITDRHAPVLEQRILAALLEGGAYERHVRRMRRENERRRTALLEAVARYLPASVSVSGTSAGLHLVMWVPFLRPAQEQDWADTARNAGVGIYPLSPLYFDASAAPTSRPAGFILGYASLSLEQIQAGIQVLGQLLAA